MEKNEQKEVYANAYQNKYYKDSTTGEQKEYSSPVYNIIFETDKVKDLGADEEGNIKFSVYLKKDAAELEKKKQPTCYLRENTFSKDNKVDIYSLKDIILNKEQLLALAQTTKVGEKEQNRAYVTVDYRGHLSPTYGKYDENAKIEGYAIEVNKVHRNMLKAEQEGINLNYVGNAWSKDGKYSIVLEPDKVKFMPMDDNGMVHLAIHALKEKKSESAPDCVIVPEQEFTFNKIDTYSLKDFIIKKSDIINPKVIIEKKATVGDKEYTKNEVYISINAENKVSLNLSKYKELSENGGYKLNGTATDVNVEERQNQIEAIKAKKSSNNESQSMGQGLPF